ncbi:hypothetical protein MGSAQ_002140, partial [marine sediment metagenome]
SDTGLVANEIARVLKKTWYCRAGDYGGGFI